VIRLGRRHGQRPEPAETLRRALEPDLFDVDPQSLGVRAGELGLRGALVEVQVAWTTSKEARANGRLAGRAPTPALEAASRSAGTTPMRSPSRRSRRDRGRT
jgi:hypothetical protein